MTDNLLLYFLTGKLLANTILLNLNVPRDNKKLEIPVFGESWVDNVGQNTKSNKAKSLNLNLNWFSARSISLKRKN